MFVDAINNLSLNASLLSDKYSASAQSGSSSLFAQTLSAAFTSSQSVPLGSSSQLSSAFSDPSDLSLFNSFNDATIQGLITSAAENGSVSDLGLAVFMLCMMMSSGSSSDLSPLLSMMASVFGSLSAENEKNKLKNEVLQSDYDPWILSEIDSSVFKSANPPDISTSGTAVIPSEAWKPCSPAIVSYENNRSPELLNAVISQFSVETSERYRPYKRGSDTYCNIYLWDVTSALNCEIPHFIDPDTGNPRKYPDIKGAVELDAEGVEYWLVNYGSAYGWREVDAPTAQSYANLGKAAVTTAGSIGHNQVLCPSPDGTYDPIRGVTISQAGSKNIAGTYISSIYGTASLGKIRYFVHE